MVRKTKAEQHPVMARVYQAAIAADQIGQHAQLSDLAERLNESVQRVKNWDERGPSADGLLLIQERLGINAAWARSGVGQMYLTSAEGSSEARPQTIGQAAMDLGAAVSGLSESRRKTIAHLVSAQIADKPDHQEAQAIDALAPGLTVTAHPAWRELAHQLAAVHPDAGVREVLTKFVDEIDRQFAAHNQAAGVVKAGIIKM